MSSATDRIEKQIVLRAPRARVWRALSDAGEFGRWFGVRLEGQFKAGAEISGALTIKGLENIRFALTVETMEPERRFSWRWHPAAIKPDVDYSQEPTTLVAFELQDAPGGTLLKVVESGFDGIPLSRRAEALRMNEGGWEQQLRNIERHVAA